MRSKEIQSLESENFETADEQRYDWEWYGYASSCNVNSLPQDYQRQRAAIAADAMLAGSGVGFEHCYDMHHRLSRE